MPYNVEGQWLDPGVWALTQHQPELFPTETQTPEGLFAQVVFNRPLSQSYSYAIPTEWLDRIQIGQRVRVPLGRGNKPTLGYCIGLTRQVPSQRVKPILEIIDEMPLLTGELLRLTKWLADYYLCGWGQVLDAALPAGVKTGAGTQTRPFVQAVPEAELPPVPARLSRKQKHALGKLRELQRQVEANQLAEMAGCGLSVVWALVRHGYATRKLIRQERDSWESNVPTSQRLEDDLQLNDEQQSIIDILKGNIQSGGFHPYLLFGVTGSGKTEIYLQAIRAVVDRGQEALVLVPEISLTPQTIERFASRFDRVAVLHSHLSAAERGAQWRRIASGQAQVVIGARSAIFAPTKRLGLIVVDEEHETSFKQESTPRYNARDVAVRRAQLLEIPVVLGSATPSLESWKNIQSQQYKLLHLSKRVGNRPLPPVQLIDLRHEPKSRSRYCAIGATLENAIREAIAQNGQIILLLNRRGYDTYLFCQRCGHVVKCRFCDVSMTYHRSNSTESSPAWPDATSLPGRLVCHHCGYQSRPPTMCPECQQSRLRYLGLGTEKLEAELQQKFPNVPMQRMDSDTMRKGGGSHARVLAAFQRGETRILFGTQMIAKGLDFPGVTLVGVVQADTILHFPDFRSSERTFQLLAQVAGRSGRGDQVGKVLVQTFCPDHPCIHLAARHDFEKFARWELNNRQAHGFPPWRRMARVIMRSRSESAVQVFAATLADGVRRELSSDIKLMGPAEAPLRKLEGYFRWHLQLLSPQSSRLHDLLKRAVLPAQPPANVEMTIDVDPINVM